MPDETLNLEEALSAWDGKSGARITAVYDAHSHRADFLERLLVLLPDPSHQIGVTWLLKRYLEKHQAVNPRDVARIYQQCPGVVDWEARLHLLQSVPLLPIAREQKQIVAVFLRAGIESDNKFVRAWSYSGFFDLSAQHEEFENEMIEHVTYAFAQEPASIQARLRQVLKKQKKWRDYFSNGKP